MCVVSMVYDKFSPMFPQPWEVRPGWPHPITPTTQPATTDPDALTKLIESFKKARDAAKVVDKLTGQPDCADPDKAKLEERVAKLEAALDRLQKKRKPTKRKPTKAKRKRGARC